MLKFVLIMIATASASSVDNPQAQQGGEGRKKLVMKQFLGYSYSLSLLKQAKGIST